MVRVVVHDGTELGAPELADGAADAAAAVTYFDGHALAAQRHGRAIDQVTGRVVRIHTERVELVAACGVVRGGEAEVRVEPAYHGERPADPEVAIEIQPAGHAHVGLVVARGPRE